jgi:small GTP-binding protein
MNNAECKDFRWDSLLDRIDKGSVIPVIGQGLYWVRTDENKEVLLYNYLAEKLAKTMGSPLPESKNRSFPKTVFQYIKEKPNDYLGLSRFLINSLAALYLTPKGPLWKLARIKPFSLFINTTYDHFLEYTLNSVRSYYTEVLHHTFREKRTGKLKPQLFDELENGQRSLVCHIYGSVDKNQVPAYTENDILETVVTFQKDMEKEFQNPFFQALKEKSFLFIGCGYEDWLFRFFIRTISNEPYQASMDIPARKFISDDFDSFNCDELVCFLKDHHSEVFYPGSSKDFVDELFSKMEAKYSKHIIPEDEFPETAFISFHGANREEARRLANHLREDGIKVWMDELELKPGEVTDETIIKAIEKCTVFIPLISEAAKQFQRAQNIVKYNIREWEWAYSRHKAGQNPRFIIPVKIDDTDWVYELFNKIVFTYIPEGKREGDYEKLRDHLLEYGDPLQVPPLEIGKKGKGAIDAYFQSLHKDESHPLNEVKMIILGDGGVGKTSLAKCLLKKKFDENEKDTPGLNIISWNFEDRTHKAEVKVRIWDFGGQEIMHATHRFFLSKRSLYILVLDGRNDEKVEYWLKYIESFGGNSPVLVVRNKIDINPSFNVDQKQLIKEYRNIKNFSHISCKTKEGFDTFISILKNTILQVEMLKTNWPLNWFTVKTRLENMSKPFISYDEYRNICIDEKITEESIQTTLLDFLHDLGLVLHYQDIYLEDTYVLNPGWVTEGVYKIINYKKLSKTKGILKLDCIGEALKKENETDYEYPPDKYRYIIQLMKEFELCYEIDKEHILIPDLLEVKECKFDFDYDDALKFIFKYVFLPKSVMHRFIVKMHRYIKDELRWNTGVVLIDETFLSTAVVKVEENRKISIYVTGAQKQYYLVFIQHTFKDIHQNFKKLEVTEEGPFKGNSIIALNYNESTGSRSPEVEGNINDLRDASKIDGLDTIALNIFTRRAILDELEDLIHDESTHEKKIHKILEANLWILGEGYSRLATDEQLKRVVETYLGKKYRGENPKKRPDLLLLEETDKRYLLIELKRPSYSLKIKDEIQPLEYRKDLKASLHDISFEILLIGGRREDNISDQDLRPDVKYLSYTVLIRKARKHLEWFINDLKSKRNGENVPPF